MSMNKSFITSEAGLVKIKVESLNQVYDIIIITYYVRIDNVILNFPSI